MVGVVGILVGLILLALVVGGIVSAIVILVDAFRTSIEDGLLSIFMPFYFLYFMFAKLRHPKKILLIALATVGPFLGGISAAFGVYGFRRYIANAKQAEAHKVLPLIAHDVVAYVNSSIDPINGSHAGLPPSTDPVPATLSDVKGMKYMSAPNDWSGTWHEIHFSLLDPQYFQYQWERTTATQGVARAVADLDGDGNPDAQFELQIQCHASASGPGCDVAPDIVKVRK